MYLDTKTLHELNVTWMSYPTIIFVHIVSCLEATNYMEKYLRAKSCLWFQIERYITIYFVKWWPQLDLSVASVLCQIRNLCLLQYQFWLSVLFWFTGDGDSVTCFYCDCKSGNWSSSEDVWKRHARTSPHCQHLLSTKGAHFVSQSLEELGEYRAPKAENVIQV